MLDDLFHKLQQQKVINKKGTLSNGAGSGPMHLHHEEDYRLIFDRSEGIIFTHDMTGRIISINPSALQLLEYTEHELKGQYIISLIPENQRHDFYDTYLPKIIDDTSAKGIMQVRTKSGTRKYWLYHNYYINNKGHEPFVIGFAQDISDRVKIEEALNVSNETFRSIFTFSGIGMMLVDTDGKILDVNAALCSFTGYSKDELLKANFFDLSPNEDNEIDVMYIKKILDKVINYYSIEKRYISKTNKILWALHTISKVSDKYGGPKFFVVQVMDISRKKELTDDLNRKNAELEAVRTDLINKIQQQEKLNYMIAHNLRGSAGNIRMLTELLKTASAEQIDPANEINQVIRYLDEGTTALINTLNKLLEVVQLNLNKNIPFDECDIAGTIAEISKQLNKTIYEKNVLIKQNLKVAVVNYPKVFLESIFYNIISNAVKYSSPDRRPEIIISSISRNNRVILSFKDNGIGIDLNKNGDKIFKLNQVFHANKESTGVGLYITRAQIESLGGTIEIKSLENVGTEFIVTI